MRALRHAALFALIAITTLGACGQATGPGDTGNGTPDATQACLAPSPCDGPQRCTGTRSFEPVTSRPCSEFCGAVPCTGSTCLPTGPSQMCPAGMRCVAYRINDPRGADSPTPCMP
ncbi:MAG: hypothetical protein Q8Q09_10195 [Deltaproteobacteria bacterium]|nr:hypothetical protein [Deltaproteobacteria bacterium]